MVLLQIAEPGASPESNTQRKVAVGIDLGTTNSLIAHFDGASLQVLQDGSGSPSLPSVVYFGASDVRIGQAAMAQASAEPANTIASAKRMLGRARGEFEDDPYVTLAPGDTLAFATAAGAKTPVEVAAAILAALRERAEPQLDAPISGAVITVPAYFDDAQRQATRQAAELAGMKVLRLLNEPTAAAVAYGLDEQAEESSVLAVYDLGGGTFDISLLRMRKGIFEVLATGGDSALGGDDFDRVLADHILAELALANPSSTQRRRVLQSARDAKEALTEQESVTLDVSDLAEALSEITIDRSVLESSIAPSSEGRRGG